MMAARAMGSGASTAHGDSQCMVTACESYLPMVKLMKKVLRSNGMEGKIKVINKRSDELKVGLDIPSRADVLVSSNSNNITSRLNFYLSPLCTFVVNFLLLRCLL